MLELVDDSFAVAVVETMAGSVPLVGRNREVGVEVSGDPQSRLKQAGRCG